MVPENHKDSRTIHYGLVHLEVVAEASVRRGLGSKILNHFPTIQQHNTDGDVQQDVRCTFNVIHFIIRFCQLTSACANDNRHNEQGNTSQKGDNSNEIHFLLRVKEIIFF